MKEMIDTLVECECEFCGEIFLNNGMDAYCSNECEIQASRAKNRIPNSEKRNKMHVDAEIYSSNGVLVGEDLGEYIYDDFIKGKINLSKKNIISFPASITNVSISFVNGFSKGLLEVMSRAKIKEQVEFVGRSRVVAKIEKVMDL